MNLLFYNIFFVIVTSTVGNIIPVGQEQIFDFVNDVRLYDAKQSVYSVGIRIASQVRVSSISDRDNEQFLKFETGPFQVLTKPANSKKRSEFKVKSSNLDNIEKIEFYLHLSAGKVVHYYSNDGKDIFLMNLKRAIASLFQFQFNSGVAIENDISGLCSVMYQSKSSTKYEKTKTDCSHWALKLHHRNEKPLSISVNSNQNTVYKFTQDRILSEIISTEIQLVTLEANKRAGSRVESIMSLVRIGEPNPINQFNYEHLDEILENLNGFVAKNLEAEVDGSLPKSELPLRTLVKEFRNDMTNDKFGKYMTSLVLVNLLPAARTTQAADFMKILKSNIGKDIRDQLIDLLAAAQTVEAHRAVTSIFNFDHDDDYPILERYLQALAVGTRPKKEIILDVFERLTNKILGSEKLEDTTIQALGTMVYHYSWLAESSFKNPLIEKVRDYFVKQLSACKKSECKQMYLRGLHNIRDPSTITLLIDIALTGDQASSVSAMKALHTFDSKLFNEEHQKIFEKIFYQLPKKFDSSARTLALDILLEMKPSANELKQFLVYLKSNDTAYEVKTYVLQRLNMVAETCPHSAFVLKRILASDPLLNNYDKLSQKGLTTAMQRPFSRAPSFNGTLLSFQEVNGGILKRGVVDMILSSGNNKLSAFKLELYTAGLSSFVSSSVEESEENNEEQTAGMTITVQDAYMRPIEFFNGQSELMGHVWSGTASEPTPAYQATTLLHDHEEYIVLQNGATVYIRILGAASIDLNGQVQLSLWNRNAHCQVDQNTGLSIVGLMAYSTSFAYLENKFTVAEEPKMKLIADVDFYSDTKLCIQLDIPQTNLWHNIVKTQQIYNGASPIKNSLNITYSLPGYTLAFNRKNNEMCKEIFNNNS